MILSLLILLFCSSSNIFLLVWSSLIIHLLISAQWKHVPLRTDELMAQTQRCFFTANTHINAILTFYYKAYYLLNWCLSKENVKNVIPGLRRALHARLEGLQTRLIHASDISEFSFQAQIKSLTLTLKQKPKQDL